MKYYFVIILIVGGLDEIFSISPHPKNFLCSNGFYLRNDFICDGVNQCGDSSDEYSDCNRGTCRPGSFACNCNRNRCLNATSRCNNVPECGDGSDEMNCGKDVVTADCTITRGKFLCQDGLKCIDFNFTCDNDCNCYDCSDESTDCLKHNENFCNTCSQPCLPTPDGPQCACCSTEEHESSPICQEILPCDPNNKCDQKCVRFFNKERCLCDENYQTSRDEITFNSYCWSNVSHENVLLYSTTNQIKAFNLTTNITTVIEDKLNCLSLTAAHNYVYCAVRRNNTAYILKISQNSDELIEIVKSDSRTIYSIGVDWITGNIYFTTNLSLSVCTNDGKICMKMKSLSLGDSYHVGLAPRFGFMFWTISSRNEHEESKIFRSAMDGSGERVLVGEDLRYPTSLVVDELTERVYWLETDVQFSIKSVQFNGKNKKEWISGLWLPWNIFAFSVFEKMTFFSTRTSTIHSAEKFNNSGVHIVDKSAASVKYVFAYNPLLQRTKIPNPCQGSCSGLCLLRPLTPRGLNHTCFCNSVKSNSSTFWCNNPIDQPESDSDIEFILNYPVLYSILFAFLAGVAVYHVIRKCFSGRSGQMNVSSSNPDKSPW
ncbi:low-density lipoprotein receptor-related protein 1B-like [Planococcus citri]|uniref:low-density lipoprotein receptor-related protein 1B-like n=1 Tax=Planococcus citri TaxID=170843 RepID=UPI0031F9A504